MKQAIEETRRISHNLLPKAIEDGGLVHAVESLINDMEENSEVVFYFQENIEGEKLPDSINLNVYRIIQEGLSNALRYSECDRIDIQ
ncbi:MAG: hypothetical protein WD599_05365 [Balneolaceae bacterium]